jgi:hypothetical protein
MTATTTIGVNTTMTGDRLAELSEELNRLRGKRIKLVLVPSDGVGFLKIELTL